MVKTHMILLLFSLLINDTIHAPLRQDDTSKIQSIGKLIFISPLLSTYGCICIVVPRCQQTLTYEEVFEILVHSSCASSMKYMNESLPLGRKRRGDSTGDDQTVASTNNIYALQTTINDHRTTIDDHRKMIHYLMNNTVNVTHLNQYYTDQHTRTTPIWNSWRDLLLLLLVFICFAVVICLLIKRLRLLDLLTAILLRRRQHHQEQLQSTSIPKKDKTAIHRRHRPPSPSLLQHTETVPMSVSNITRDYLRHQRDSNSSL